MDTIFNKMNTSNRIKALLAANGKTYKELAAVLSCTPETITDRMRKNNWDLPELEKIAKLFKIETKDLV